MIAALGLLGGLVLSLVVLIARGLLTDELKGRIQQRTRAHLDATLGALPADVRACWEEEWRAELAAKLGMPVTAWQFVCGIRRTAAALVDEVAPATASERHGAPERRARHVTPTLRAAILRNRGDLVFGVVTVGAAAVVVATGGALAAATGGAAAAAAVAVATAATAVVVVATGGTGTAIAIVTAGGGSVAVAVAVAATTGGIVAGVATVVAVVVVALTVAGVVEALDRLRT